MRRWDELRLDYHVSELRQSNLQFLRVLRCKHLLFWRQQLRHVVRRQHLRLVHVHLPLASATPSSLAPTALASAALAAALAAAAAAAHAVAAPVDAALLGAGLAVRQPVRRVRQLVEWDGRLPAERDVGRGAGAVQ